MPPALVFLIIASVYKPKQLFLPAIIIISIIYYGIGSIPHLILLLSLISISWLMAFFYQRFRANPYADLFLGLAVILNLSALMIWKYGHSIVDMWNSLGWVQVSPPGLLLPLGISFYVLQQIGYLLDLRRERASFTTPIRYAAFVLFFPQLLAGPIVTHRRMTKEFSRLLGGITLEGRLMMACQGIGWFSIGLFKKVILADGLGRIATPLMSKAAFGDLTIIEAWEVALSGTTRVYFDFCGYSEMAVGLALFVGLKLPANFNAPFRSNTLRQFWTRWHITFHHFVRDHIYSPTRRLTKNWPWGNALALFFAITLSSLWHGNNLQYFFWGILVWMSLFITTRLFPVFHPAIKLILTIFFSITILAVLGVYFTAPDFDVAHAIVLKLVDFSDIGNAFASLTPIHWQNIAFIFLLNFIARTEISSQNLINGDVSHSDRHFLGFRPPPFRANFGWLAFFCILLFISFNYVGLSPPFVYFDF